MNCIQIEDRQWNLISHIYQSLNSIFLLSFSYITTLSFSHIQLPLSFSSWWVCPIFHVLGRLLINFLRKQLKLVVVDAEIEIKILEDLATGSQLLTRGRNVTGLVDILKSSSLLLEGKTRRTVKLHDIIRDVARSVATRDDQYAFLSVKGVSCLPINYRTRRLLQFVESDNSRFPNGMVCPDMHTLWLESNNKPQQFPKSFFEGTDNLKMLMLKGKHAFLKQISVQSIDNVNVLILDGCDLNEISLSILPENLETLRILKCRVTNPLDLSKMKSLRKLEVVCDNEIEMVQKDMSTLPTSLVELHIPGGFRIRDAEGKTPMAMSWELNRLTALRSLNMRLEDSKSCPNEKVVASLLDFIIDVGNGWEKYDSRRRSGDLHMRSVFCKNTSIEGMVKVLVEGAQEVILEGVKGTGNGSSNSRSRAFSTLKSLSITSCDDMEHLLVWKAQNEIQQSQPLSSFSNLTKLEINRCLGLKYLFSASVAECLVQLEYLTISNCPSLGEVVIRSERVIDDGVIINFPKLKFLSLWKLQRLRRFHGEKINSTTLTENAATIESDCLFVGTVVFPSLEELHIGYVNVGEIWGENCCNLDSFGELRFLYIQKCDNLEYAIPVAMLHTFQNLKKLEIWKCDSMRSEVEGSNSELPPLVALHDIDLYTLPSLIQTGLNSTSTNLYPNLETLFIDNCKSLRNVFLPSIVKHLVRLQILNVKDCEMMSEIIGEEEKEGVTLNEFVFPELTTLQLHPSSNFKSFCFSDALLHQSHMASKVSFPKLAELDFYLKTNKFQEILVGINDSISETKNLVIKSDNKLQVPSKWKLQFPYTETLILENCWWHGNFCISNNLCIEAAGGESLVDRAEEVMLEDVKGSPNGFSNREAFSNMTNLSIDSCEYMEHVACIQYFETQQSQPLTSFSRLTRLRINSCSGLKYLFSVFVAECLVQLRHLHIENCPSLEVVIRNERTIHGVITNFPKLKELILADLPALRSFCGESRGRSSNSTTIMGNTDASTSGSQSLFDGMVTFPALERLQIQSLTTSEVWERNCYSNDSFCQLKVLYIRNCPNLEFAIPLSMTGMFQNLLKLEIRECVSMSSEVESSSSNECSNEELALVALRSIHLYKMPALTQTRLNSRMRNLYPNLETLDITECNILRNVFLPSVAKDLTVCLKELTVKSCEIISELIGKQGEDDKFVFLELTKLQLFSLPNFTSFYFDESVGAPTGSRQHQSLSTPKVSFPKLVELGIDVKTIILEEMELGRIDSTSEITKLTVCCDNKEQLPSTWQFQLTKVEELELKNCLWYGSSREHDVGQLILSFQRLKVVTVDSCGVSSLFSCSVFGNLHQLKMLQVRDCPLLEEVVREENNIVGTSENTISLLQLESIELSNLPKLKSFGRSTRYTFNMPLKSISLRKCPQMENFTCLELSTQLMPDFNTQIQTYLSNPNRDNEEKMRFTCY